MVKRTTDVGFLLAGFPVATKSNYGGRSEPQAILMQLITIFAAFANGKPGTGHTEAEGIDSGIVNRFAWYSLHHQALKMSGHKWRCTHLTHLK